MLKAVPVAMSNQSEPVLTSRKKLEYKWGMNVLGECEWHCWLEDYIPWTFGPLW